MIIFGVFMLIGALMPFISHGSYMFGGKPKQLNEILKTNDLYNYKDKFVSSSRELNNIIESTAKDIDKAAKRLSHDDMAQLVNDHGYAQIEIEGPVIGNRTTSTRHPYTDGNSQNKVQHIERKPILLLVMIIRAR